MRICLFVCAGILLANAVPVPQETTDLVKTLDNNDPSEESNPTTEVPQSDNEAEESDLGTRVPISNDGDETSDLAETANSDEENTTKLNQETSESSSNDSEGEEDDTDTSDNGSESAPEENESTGSEPITEDNSNSEDENNESEVEGSGSNNESEGGNEDKPENGNDDESEYSSDTNESSYNDDGNENDFESSDDEQLDTSDDDLNEEDVSKTGYAGIFLRVYKISKADGDIICQELSRKDQIVQNKCFFTPQLFGHTRGVFTAVFNKYANGQDFICQEIISYSTGPVQVLCASHGQHFYRQSVLVDPFGYHPVPYV